MLALLLTTLLQSQIATITFSLQPLHNWQVAKHETGFGTYSYARDAEYEYLATPRGLYRARRLATGPLELIAFADEPVSALAATPDALYAGRGLTNYGGWPDHTLLRSRDRGATFEPIDAGLLDCQLEPFGYPCEYLIVTQIEVRPGAMLVAATGNIVATPNEGGDWFRLHPSSGKPAAVGCPIVFEVAGERLFTGTECPLDDAWIGEATLTNDLMSLRSPLRRLPLEMQNRNVQFIRDVGDGMLFASVEGGLLKSSDNDTTWRWVIRYESGGAVRKYPYATQFVRWSRNPNVMLLGGFDKANVTAYLAYSMDAGESWSEIPLDAAVDEVMLLAEDADGRLLAGLLDGDQERFTLAELKPGERRSRKGRAVRH